MARAEGTVLEVHAARCVVAGASPGPIVCRYRGRLARGERRDQALIVVGDRVVYEIDAGASAAVAGVVVAVHPRRNVLARRSSGSRRVTHVFAANLDHALIVASFLEPPLRIGFIDRCLASARVWDIEPIVILNKIDLASAEDRAEAGAIVNVYERAGFPCHVISVATGEGLPPLLARLGGRVSVVIGQSGVGKTSLLNALVPGVAEQIGPLSAASGKGMHTTSRSRLFPLPGGGYLADTPGVRAFALERMDVVQIALAYPEIQSRAGGCRFSPCSHVHEPSCAVRDALDRGEIVRWRYESYVRLVRSLEEDAGEAGV